MPQAFANTLEAQNLAVVRRSTTSHPAQWPPPAAAGAPAAESTSITSELFAEKRIE